MKEFYILYMIIAVTLFNALMSPLISFGDIKYDINTTVNLDVADVLKIPTESIIILNAIISNEYLKIEEPKIQLLKSNINIEHSTDVIFSIPILLKNNSVLHLSNTEIIPVLNSFIRYHNDIFGLSTDEVYYKLSKSIKSREDTSLDFIFYPIFHEWLTNTQKGKKSVVANLISEFLPVSKVSNTMGILSSLSIMIEQQQLFTIIDKIKKDQPDNNELINQMENLKNNLLHPDQAKRAKIIY